MAKQQVIELDNGATIIYQKRSDFNGCSFVIGFRSGAQLDGKYKGLSHLLEHLMFRTPDKNMTTNILNNILQYSIDQNAFTSRDFICSAFSATHNNVRLALQNNVRMFKNTRFTQDQINKEIEIVKQEIRCSKEDDLHEAIMGSAIGILISDLQEAPDGEGYDILGSSKTLKSISPEFLREYVKRYFTTDNLIISVTSNKPLQETINLCAEEIISKFPRAKSEKYIIPFPEPKWFRPINQLCAFPNDLSQNVSIDMLVRERADFAEDPDKEFAFGIIEEYLMNSLGGPLYLALRENNNLVYNYSLSNVNFGSARYKMYSCITTSPKMRKTIRSLCEVIKSLGNGGITEKQFNIVKNTLIDQQNANLQKFKSCSAMDNFNHFVSSIPFIDYKRALDIIKKMTYEEFNEYMKSVYQSPNVSLAVDGNFDSRKMYNLIEIEQMVGNETNKQEKAQLNAPIIQFTPVAEKPNGAMLMFADALTQLMGQGEFEETGKPSKPPVKIDNEVIK